MERDFYTLKEVAEILALSTRTVSKRIKSKDLKAYQEGKLWRVTKENLTTYINQTKGE